MMQTALSRSIHIPNSNIFRKAHYMMTEDAALGRTITCGLSYMQRIGRGAEITLWRPEGRKNQPVDFSRFDWATIRQVEILQENSAQQLESMDIEDGIRSIREHCMMRPHDLHHRGHSR